MKLASNVAFKQAEFYPFLLTSYKITSTGTSTGTERSLETGLEDFQSHRAFSLLCFLGVVEKAISQLPALPPLSCCVSTVILDSPLVFIF